MTELTTFAPRTVLDPAGNPEGVILNYREYRSLLRLLVQYADWEDLPESLQDAIDNLLADEAEEEDGEPVTLPAVLEDLSS
jgi:hypothetical protein